MAPLSLCAHLALNTCGNVPWGVVVNLQPEAAKTITEDDYRTMAQKVARGHGWLVNHVERGRGRDGRWLTPCARGFPDNLFVHPRGRLLVVEFKGHKARTKPELQEAQQEWLQAFANLEGATVIRSRPLDWPQLQGLITAVTPPW